MIVTMTRNGDNGTLKAVKEPNDPKYYSESTLLHHIKLELIKQGYDVIKKLMWKDGHLTDETVHYIRTRMLKKDPDSIYVWDIDYAIRSLTVPWNDKGEIDLAVKYNIFF